MHSDDIKTGSIIDREFNLNLEDFFEITEY